jgi:ABC-type amino acid transport substrate-binding protein
LKIVHWLSGLLLCVVASVAAADMLSDIRTSQTIRLGYLEASPPFSYEQDGRVMGYSAGLCEAVVEHLRADLGLDRLRIQWVPVTLQDRFDQVEKGGIHMECGNSTWTLSRQKRVEFSLMTFVDGGSVLVRNDTDFFKLEDFQGRRIGVVRGTTTERSLAGELTRRGVQATVVPVDSAEDGLVAVQSGAADGYASDRLVLIGLALSGQDGVVFRVVDEDFSLEPYALVLPRDERGLRLAVNRALTRIYTDGEIGRIYDRWLGHLGKPGMLLNALYYLQRLPE